MRIECEDRHVKCEGLLLKSEDLKLGLGGLTPDLQGHSYYFANHLILDTNTGLVVN